MPLDLSEAVLQRALAQVEPQAPARPPKTAGRTDLNSTLLAILGAGADGASTYHLMRQGSSEDNAIFAGRSPATTGLAVAGSGVAQAGLTHLLGKKFPKLAKALMGNQAGLSIGLAAENFARPTGRAESSMNTYRKAVAAAMARDDRQE